MIYTSYRSNIKNIPINENVKIVTVYRSGRVPNRDDIVILRDLGPTLYLRGRYKKNKDWSYYEKEYMYQLYNNTFTKIQMLRLIDIVKRYDVILICCEEDSQYCHRRLLADELQYITDIKYYGEWKAD